MLLRWATRRSTSGTQIAVMTLQGLQDGQNPVWVAPQMIERLIDKSEVEFHQRDSDASDLVGSTEQPFTVNAWNESDSRRSHCVCKPDLPGDPECL